jgi:hypothetical protein
MTRYFNTVLNPNECHVINEDAIESLDVQAVGEQFCVVAATVSGTNAVLKCFDTAEAACDAIKKYAHPTDF